MLRLRNCLAGLLPFWLLQVQGCRLSLQGHLHTSLQGSDHHVQIPAVWLPFFHRNFVLTAPMHQ